jgi:hypothetical protein
MPSNLFGPRRNNDPQVIEQIKSWVRDTLHPDEDTAIMVTELRCTEPDCPPIETVIAFLKVSQPTRQYKLHKAIADIIQTDITTLATIES